MHTARVFWSGNSQAVRIPKELQLQTDEVEIRKEGESLILTPRQPSWQDLMDSLDRFSDDFMEAGRNQPPEQRREEPFS